jgi:hypothetical protein
MHELLSPTRRGVLAGAFLFSLTLVSGTVLYKKLFIS